MKRDEVEDNIAEALGYRAGQTVTVHLDSQRLIARARQDALAAWETVRKVALMWGISKEHFVEDWLSHVYGEKSGLEREPAFHD